MSLAKKYGKPLRHPQMSLKIYLNGPNSRKLLLPIIWSWMMMVPKKLFWANVMDLSNSFLLMITILVVQTLNSIIGKVYIARDLQKREQEFIRVSVLIKIF